MTAIDYRKVLALFVRHPIQGRVKTRLARDLGDAGACSLYKAIVSDILQNLKASGFPFIIFHDGNDDFVTLPAEWTEHASGIAKQTGVCIGERMSKAFEELFAAGAERVCLIGSDVPGLDVDLLQSAFEALDESDAAIAPAFDGGYCLIAFRRERFLLRPFKDIPWSTSSVLRATLTAFADSGAKVNVLASRQDVDTIEDLLEYCNSPSESATSTNEWLRLRGYPL